MLGTITLPIPIIFSKTITNIYQCSNIQVQTTNFVNLGNCGIGSFEIMDRVQSFYSVGWAFTAVIFTIIAGGLIYLQLKSQDSYIKEKISNELEKKIKNAKEELSKESKILYINLQTKIINLEIDQLINKYNKNTVLTSFSAYTNLNYNVYSYLEYFDKIKNDKYENIDIYKLKNNIISILINNEILLEGVISYIIEASLDETNEEDLNKKLDEVLNLINDVKKIFSEIEMEKMVKNKLEPIIENLKNKYMKEIIEYKENHLKK